MKPWRLFVLATLWLVPLAVLATVGSVLLWREGWFLRLWWLFPLCWAAAYFVSWRWRTRFRLPPIEDVKLPLYWTPRDERAWSGVRERALKPPDVAPDKLLDPHFYLQTAIDLGLEVARHYDDDATDPLGSRTVTELLAAGQLVLEDTAAFVDRSVPGSHLVTVDQWRLLAQAPGWLSTVSNVTWAVRVVFNPINIARYFTSRLVADSATRQVRENFLAWFYATFVRHVGHYAIELHSGRLRGGVERYRRLQRQLVEESGSVSQEASAGDAEGNAVAPPDDHGTARVAPSAAGPAVEAGAASAVPAPLDVCLVLVGQVNAGKSSLINSLLGRASAEVDVLPTTKSVARYRHRLPSRRDSLVLLDTSGYGDAGATAAQLRETESALSQADLVLLVMDATSPARQPDLDVLDRIEAWFDGRTDRRPPPCLGVLTHIDGLSPLLEWAPPYDWHHPARPKERSIAAAVEYVREQFGTRLSGIVPVCTDMKRERVFGVSESLVPAIVAALGEARGCAVLRTLHAELDQTHTRKLFGQLAQAGLELLTTLARDKLDRISASVASADRRPAADK